MPVATSSEIVIINNLPYSRKENEIKKSLRHLLLQVRCEDPSSLKSYSKKFLC